MSVRHRRIHIALLLCAPLMLLATGCQQAQRKPDQPTRAVWVTRYDYKTPTDVARIMDNCRRAGFNTVLFQVRGDGTVSYPSRIEPWSQRYDFRDPGYDPLATAVTEAHRRGLQLHAWVNVMPAWRGPEPPPIRNQLYNAHPNWFWYDAYGKRQPLEHRVGDTKRGWYVSLNPCLPEVRQYLVGLMHEIVSRYPVDGLHLDYIRFPNEAVVPGEKVPDYPRDRRTLALFYREVGATPEAHPAAWNHWRSEQITELVAEVRRMMHRTRPEAKLTAAVKANPQAGYPHFQDAQRWARGGLVDALYLMNYTPSIEEFAARNALWPKRSRTMHTDIIPGLMIQETGGKSDHALAEIARQQIQSAARARGHFAIFAYSLMFDEADGAPAQVASADPAKLARAERRKVIIPYMHWLAELASTRTAR